MWLWENILITEEMWRWAGNKATKRPLQLQTLNYYLSKTWKYYITQRHEEWVFLQTSLWQGSPWSYITKKTSALGNSRIQQKWPCTIEQLELNTLHARGTCFKILYFILVYRFGTFFKYLPLFSFIISKVQWEAGLSWSQVLSWSELKY